MPVTESLVSPSAHPCRQVVPTPTNPTTFPSFDAHIAMWPPDPRARARAPHPSFGPLVIRNNESPFNYPSLKLPIPKVNISMLCSLSSDVAVPGLPERFDLYVAPLGFERKNPAVAAFISNCHARSFRLEAIAKMRELGLEVHQYGECNRTHTAQGTAHCVRKALSVGSAPEF